MPMNKRLEDQQPYLCRSWYTTQNDKFISPEISTIIINTMTNQSIMI